MKYSLSEEQRFFFVTNHFLEMEELLTVEEVSLMNSSISSALSGRLGKEAASPSSLFSKGWNLWQESEFLQKLLFQRKLGEIAAQLTDRKLLKLGFSQLYPTSLPPLQFSFLRKPLSLDSLCSFHGLVLGLMLCLKDSSTLSFPFSKVAGNGYFFMPSMSLKISQLAQSTEGLYLLLTYLDPKTLFRPSAHDPQLIQWMNRGYSAGDKLPNEWHPIVYHEV